VSGERDDDRSERPRRSWREIDQLRDGARHHRDERRPRGAAAEARARSATAQYLKQAGQIFSGGRGGAEGERLAAAVRAAQGAPALAEACAAYRDALGLPDDPALLGRFLESGDAALVVGALGALRAARQRGAVLGAGLRSQARMLADDRDDEIAEAAEALLASL
jgi:hypothetical protein